MSDFEEDIHQCLKVLESGGSILYPTDTVWGLGCDATNPEAVGNVFSIKERPLQKSMIILVAEEKDILKYVAGPDSGIFTYLEKTERPTTVIYEGAIGLAENAVNADGSIAIRIVKDSFCKHLIRRFRKPIISTSANISGDPAPALFRDVKDIIRQRVDYTVNYRQSDETTVSPSSIIKWKNGLPQIIR